MDADSLILSGGGFASNDGQSTHFVGSHVNLSQCLKDPLTHKTSYSDFVDFFFYKVNGAKVYSATDQCQQKCGEERRRIINGGLWSFTPSKALMNTTLMRLQRPSCMGKKDWKYSDQVLELTHVAWPSIGRCTGCPRMHSVHSRVGWWRVFGCHGHRTSSRHSRTVAEGAASMPVVSLTFPSLPFVSCQELLICLVAEKRVGIHFWGPDVSMFPETLTRCPHEFGAVAIRTVHFACALNPPQAPPSWSHKHDFYREWMAVYGGGCVDSLTCFGNKSTLAGILTVHSTHSPAPPPLPSTLALALTPLTSPATTTSAADAQAVSFTSPTSIVSLFVLLLWTIPVLVLCYRCCVCNELRRSNKDYDGDIYVDDFSESFSESHSE